MITFAWYNVVAIIVGVLFAWWLSKIAPNGRIGGNVIILVFWLACVLFFYALWGGIFWR